MKTPDQLCAITKNSAKIPKSIGQDRTTQHSDNETDNKIESFKNQLNPNAHPWKPNHFEEHPWIKVVSDKTRKTTVSNQGQKTHLNHREHKKIARTASAPINIPQKRESQKRLTKKADLVRVNSAGGPGLSPGGTHRITYDRGFLLECRQSPLSLTPPSDLPIIPGATAPPERRRRRKLEKTDSTISNASVTSVASTISNFTDEEPTQ